MRVTVIPIVVGALRTVPKGLEKGVGIVRNWRKNRDHSDYNIIQISQSTEKSPGDLRKLAVSQTPVKAHQLTLMWKPYNNDIDNNNNIKHKVLLVVIY